jgi:rubrerythrin
MPRIIFTARELLQFAVKNEKDGEAFYRQIAARVPTPPIRRLFLLLARQDARHTVIFQQMLSRLDKTAYVNADADEYNGYMVAYYTANILFSSTLAAELPASPDPIAALDFGIRLELDSITYYTQARELVPDRDAAVIDRIIQEERVHFLRLSEMKRRFLAKTTAQRKAP